MHKIMHLGFVNASTTNYFLYYELETKIYVEMICGDVALIIA